MTDKNNTNISLELKEFLNNPNKFFLAQQMIDNCKVKYYSSTCFSKFTSDNIPEFKKKINENKKSRTLGQHLQYLVDSRDIINDSEIYNRALLNRSYWNRLIHDKISNPSKNKLLRIGIALELNNAELDELLCKAGYTLKDDARDAGLHFIISKNEYDLDVIDDLLTNEGLNSVFDVSELN